MVRLWPCRCLKSRGVYFVGTSIFDTPSEIRPLGGIGALPLYTPHTRRRGAREQVAASGLNLPLTLKAGVTLSPSRAVSLDRSPVSSLRCGPLHATVRP